MTMTMSVGGGGEVVGGEVGGGFSHGVDGTIVTNLEHLDS